jgi:predicted aldo/keto reductase-like oxidoreductase
MQRILIPDLGISVSRLGFGAMRLPTREIDGKQAIDREEAITMIRRAIDAGVNYVDTAYGYHGGESERVVGEALQNGYREKVYLATKLPCWLVKTREDMDRLLDEQLQKLKTDHFDFYLLHALNHGSFENMKKLGYHEFLDKAVASGKIRFPSFSYHDDGDLFPRIIDDYPWKMAQIQLNLLDGEYQAGLRGMRYAAKKGVHIVVMEPLRGGSLAMPPKQVKDLYETFPTRRSSVEWAFRYLYNMPEVMTILSGMSTMEQVEDNLRIFQGADVGVITPQEEALLAKVKDAYLSRIKTSCTGCNYCQPCPENVAISNIFRGYDEASMLDKMPGFRGRYQTLTDEGKDASKCIACGKCERACPQHLPVIRYLKEIRSTMENG